MNHPAKIARSPRKHPLAAVLSTVCALALSASASAATVTASPAQSMVDPGDSVQVVLSGSGFDANADGGDLTVSWDPTVLAFDEIVIANPPWDTQFVDDSNADTGILSSIFLGTSQFGGVGPAFDIATVIFDVVGNAGSSTTVTVGDALVGWIQPGAIAIDVTYDQALVQVQAVPVPTSVALLAGALAALAGIRRRPDQLA